MVCKAAAKDVDCARQPDAKFQAAVPMPRGWDLRADSLIRPKGLTLEMVERAGALIDAWDESDDCYPWPLVVLLYEMLAPGWNRSLSKVHRPRAARKRYGSKGQSIRHA